ncbi:MAG: hypothetical protein FWD12_05550 [Alphaproteobacteria bacterium]|nr:hypothetical protein [Alphaproteobacteria bacterium]
MPRCRLICLLALGLLTALPAAAVTRRNPPPKQPSSNVQQLGKFQSWTAVTRQESGETICYVFSHPEASAPAIAGRGRPALTVTERSSGRDTVAFSAGFTFPEEAEPSLQVEQTAHPFYTVGHDAFARDGAATTQALRKGRLAVMRSPGPEGAQVVDTFGLRGFEQAYAAIQKACPPP